MKGKEHLENKHKMAKTIESITGIIQEQIRRNKVKALRAVCVWGCSSLCASLCVLERT